LYREGYPVKKLVSLSTERYQGGSLDLDFSCRSLTLREIEKTVSEKQDELNALKIRIKELLLITDKYEPDFFYQAYEMVSKENNLSLEISHIEIQKNKLIQTLVNDFISAAFRGNADSQLLEIKNQLDPKKFVKFKKQKADTVYDEMKSSARSQMTPGKISLLHSKCVSFLKATQEKKSTKATFFLALKEKLENLLNTLPVEGLEPRSSAVASVRISSDHLDTLFSEELRSSQEFRRRSTVSVDVILESKVSGQYEGYSAQDVAVKLKKILLLNFRQFQDEIQKIFERLDSEFVPSLRDSNMEIVSPEHDGSIVLHKGTQKENRVEIGESLSSTPSGNMYVVLENGEPSDLIAKKFNVAVFGTQVADGVYSAERIFNEVETIDKLQLVKEKHDNVVHYSDRFMLQNPDTGMTQIIFLLEKMDAMGPEFIESLKSKPFNYRMREVWAMVKDVSIGLIYLQEKGYTFDEIHLGNIGFKDGHWKLMEFDSCHPLSESRGERLDLFRLGEIVIQFMVGELLTEFDYSAMNAEKFFLSQNIELTESEKALISGLQHKKNEKRLCLDELISLADSNLKRQKKRSSDVINRSSSADPNILIDSRGAHRLCHPMKNVTLSEDPIVDLWTLNEDVTVTLTNGRDDVVPAGKTVYIAPLSSYELPLPQIGIEPRYKLVYTVENGDKQSGYLVDYPTNISKNSGYISHSPVKGPIFGRGGRPDPNHIQQRMLGDCYFVSALSTLARIKPEFISHQLMTENEDGTVSVFFHRKNEDGVFTPEEVKVAKTLPSVGLFSYLSAGAPWVGLVEKAYAIWKGGTYAEIEGGYPVEALESLTGRRGLNYDIEADATVHEMNPLDLQLEEYPFLINETTELNLEADDFFQEVADFLSLSKEELVSLNSKMLAIYEVKSCKLYGEKKDFHPRAFFPNLVIPKTPEFRNKMIDLGYLKTLSDGVDVLTSKILDKDQFIRSFGDLEGSELIYQQLIPLLQENTLFQIPKKAKLRLMYPDLTKQDADIWLRFVANEKVRKRLNNYLIGDMKTLPLLKQKRFISFLGESGISELGKAVFLKKANLFCTNGDSSSDEECDDRYHSKELSLYDTILEHSQGIKSFMVISTYKFKNNVTFTTNFEGNRCMLYGPHSYEVVGCETLDNGRRSITIRNPHGAHDLFTLELSTVFRYFQDLSILPFYEREGNLKVDQFSGGMEL